ncbi:hypothetical protein RB195_025953 [Necator americanus]|uniref:Uncharacterized protein n=1 Tax=Necator americanus TaxID=51031 RepID=A0ABR1EUL7_NECAM
MEEYERTKVLVFLTTVFQSAPDSVTRQGWFFSNRIRSLSEPFHTGNPSSNHFPNKMFAQYIGQVYIWSLDPRNLV